ncbi:MAG: 2-oxoglutarate dehydrogenase E1 component [Waddliaceae bacterium]|jgi:2-oxoglutarate dehydrogenase E1 component|nr:2-oxoglutarate dehydrogenase E1 component [Waddliaceae bacterium]MBT3578499.1 2-oxoglutarate dehydrogenase E1 component [Waddliaceae bacterium]MBT4445146.1 2-oxoglutarate dehydrogenase E1 component [Waddliaceae bacterium]MBT6927964.1 2-oxoglutarate dehydrogenase E1 component [Waddliaceae bacterium]MBT7263920.1 2-oxoglutarate dehydrogenase E1 component [Waddliaceae bacterium]
MSEGTPQNIDTANIELFEQLYVEYQKSPSDVPVSWRHFFSNMDKNSVPPRRHAFSSNHDASPVKSAAVPVAAAGPVSAEDGDTIKGLRVKGLIDAYRSYGYLLADVNPVAAEPVTIDDAPQLQLSALGFVDEDLGETFPTCGILDVANAPLSDIIAALKDTYCSNIGVEYMGFNNPDVEQWIQQHLEPIRSKPQLTIEDKQLILHHLNKSELFETFLHTKYVGQKRFSIEGGETLIPLLVAILESGTSLGMETFIIGMAHRGRLNVLANVLQKSHADLFSQFEESYVPEFFQGSGDVKYHKGFFSDVTTSGGNKARIRLVDNSSHLESVDPVVQGYVRSHQQRDADIERSRIVPILIHGDASFAGQGVVYETMQMCNLLGYSTGGTIHVIIDNNIGFTTLPKNGRSTRFSSDIAHTFGAPVFHVNAEHPEECVFATMLAVEFRQHFHCDVVINMHCYRKWGHNEGDEPSFTQPIEYQLIKKKKPIRELYRDELIATGVIEKYMAERLEKEFKESLQKSLKGSKASFLESEGSATPSWKPPSREELLDTERRLFEPAKTGVDGKTIVTLAKAFCTVPEGLTIHKKLINLITSRLEMVQEGSDVKSIDWGMGEHLAMASLLNEGHHIRLSGQDSRRGTFSHRHSSWTDQVKNLRYFPLRHLRKGQGVFEVFNSPLSEFGVLGFEYGYSAANLDALVIWEAQFGDFSNGAQIVIDQFIATSEQKWGVRSNLVMFLPHGYEGQGPEHSSARIERFLQLSGDLNIQVTNPTTPAQLFHLLRRQALRTIKKPLIVFTPKGLLRYPGCVSSLDDLATGTFEEVLPDPEPPSNASKVILCSGRIYYDLIAERKNFNNKTTAILRLEQLYPLNIDKIKSAIGAYGGCKKILWVQDEPSNMGAWDFMRPQLNDIIPEGTTLSYVGRERSASPAAGSYALHKKQGAEIMRAIFGDIDEEIITVSRSHNVRG